MASAESCEFWIRKADSGGILRKGIKRNEHAPILRAEIRQMSLGHDFLRMWISAHDRGEFGDRSPVRTVTRLRLSLQLCPAATMLEFPVDFSTHTSHVLRHMRTQHAIWKAQMVKNKTTQNKTYTDLPHLISSLASCGCCARRVQRSGCLLWTAPCERHAVTRLTSVLLRGFSVAPKTILYKWHSPL